MSMSRISVWFVIGAALAVLAACGGGGQGLRADDGAALRVASTAVPPVSSGERVDHVIPLEGGCGGPYVLQVVEGAMPEGLYLDNETHAITGYVLEEGAFSFTVQVTDTGCTPFASTRAAFEMDVPVGGLRVIQVLQDGVPAMVFPGDDGYEELYGNRDEPAIPPVVYGEFATFDFVVAGGVAPYRAVVYDDPTNPEDGPLPTGAVVPNGSTSITGSASQVGPGGGPFVVTLKVTDGVGSEALFTFLWLVRTPPIVLITDALADGTCGESYNDSFSIVDGVPPFQHEFVAAGPGVGVTYEQTQAPDTSGDVVFESPNPPTLNVPDAAGHFEKIDASYYPDAAEDMGGSYDYRAAYVTPPEGVRLDEETGVLSGVPRRRGAFRIHYQVRSALVPNSFGQRSWATYDFSFTPAAMVVQDPAYTLPGTFEPAPYSFIP